MSDKRVCDACHVEKELKSFYKNHDTCRSCMQPKVHNMVKLADQVEQHRQEREIQRQMRAQLKAIARKRIGERKRTRTVARQRKLIPEVVPESIDVTPEIKELASRELSRRRLIEFIKEFHPRYKAGWVHHDICRRLEKFLADVDAGLSPRLMLLMPPRHGKSEIASKNFPAWGLGHFPHFEFIACSYNVSLALDFSRAARALMRTDRYGTLFSGAVIDPEAQGAEAWRLTGIGAGGYVAAGIGGPITGKGAHVLIIDDPIKNAEEAESIDQRQKIWDWYRSTAYTRLAPGGGVLVIQTQWHDDDLAGRLQAEMKDDPEADRFEIVKYPAIAVDDEEYRMAGDALHPERYNVEALLKIKRTIGLRYWAALYQQDPVPDEGAYFSKDMFLYRTENVDLSQMHIYQAWDWAISEKRQNDFNVGVTVGLDYKDNLHVIEVRRFKTADAGRIIDQVLDMHQLYDKRAHGGGGVQAVGAEDGQIWRTMQALLKKRMTERRIYPSFEVQKPLTDKMVRARPLQGRMQHQKVTFPRAAPWLEALIREFLRFPAGLHDDHIDALAWAVTLVIGKAPPVPKVYRGPKREKTVAERVKDLTRGGGNRTHMSS